MADMSVLNTQTYTNLSVDDVVALVLTDQHEREEYKLEVVDIIERYRAIRNLITISSMSDSELTSVCCEEYVGRPLTSRVFSAFNAMKPLLEMLQKKGLSLFSKQKEVNERRKVLEQYLSRIVASKKEATQEEFKSIESYFYEYKSVVNLVVSLNSAIAETDKYLRDVMNGTLLRSPIAFGYTNVSDGEYRKVDLTTPRSGVQFAYPTKSKFFETNTIDDLMFVTNQIAKSCAGLELVLGHSSNFKTTITSLLAKPNAVKSMIGNTDAVFNLQKQINDAIAKCDNVVNNLGLLLKTNKTLTVLVSDLWENVFGVLNTK